MLRHRFQPSRLWSSQWCWDAGFNPRVYGAALVAMINLASGVWILLLDDSSSMIFRQPTEPPPKFSIFRGWVGQISKYFRFWLNAYFSWLDWQSFEILWAWSHLEYGLRECTVKPFEATRNDRGECLDIQSRPPPCSELVVSILWTRGEQSSACASVLLNWFAKVKTECKSCRRRDHVALKGRSPHLERGRICWRNAALVGTRSLGWRRSSHSVN